MAAEAAEGSSLLRKWFRPTVFRERGTAEAAALAYEQAVVESVQTSAAEIAFNVGTACSSGGTERGGVRMPARDFIVASARMRLDNDEPVYVTARWRWAADLEKYTATSHLDRAQCQWVEQRSLRFGDPLDPPENIMIVDRPGICQKPYMCVVLVLLPAARTAELTPLAPPGVLVPWAATTQARVVLCDGAPAASTIPHSSDRAWCRAPSRDLARTSAACWHTAGNPLRAFFCVTQISLHLSTRTF